jgi:hypothetical protein
MGSTANPKNSNVDRITALWQAQQSFSDPNSWWSENRAEEGTWSVARGTVQKPSDGLVPFRKPPSGESEGDGFWSSNEVRDWTTFGYTYHGKYVTRDSSGKYQLSTFDINPAKTEAKEINSFINQFYSWMDLPTNTYPSLIAQFYPIDVSQVEALTGNDGPGRPHILPHHSGRFPKESPPDAENIDYDFISEGLIKNGRLRQWDLHILAEK